MNNFIFLSPCQFNFVYSFLSWNDLYQISLWTEIILEKRKFIEFGILSHYHIGSLFLLSTFPLIWLDKSFFFKAFDRFRDFWNMWGWMKGTELNIQHKIIRKFLFLRHQTIPFIFRSLGDEGRASDSTVIRSSSAIFKCYLWRLYFLTSAFLSSICF